MTGPPPLPDAEPAPALVLVGMMGSGKSSVGAQVAHRLARRFVDLDEEIVAAAGRPIADVFRAEGEAGFRDREQVALRDCLDGTDPPPVVATGGGVVVREENRAALRRVDTVWLRAEPETLHRRVGADAGRPLLGDDPLASLRRLAGERADWYAAAARRIVDVDDLEIDEVVEAVVAGAPKGS